ncbi:MAG: hypothetical protein C4303_10390, partial [candidate division GAL15 bacterium]
MFADRAIQMGLIKNVDQYARMIEMPQQSDIVEAVDPDIAKARRENHMLAQGIPTPPDDFDNHSVHIKEHNDFRKSARYALLPPDIKGDITTHIQAHETLAAEAL